MVHPTPNGLVGHRHSALRQQILDVTQAEGEPEVEPYCLVNDLGREAISGVADLVHPRGATRPPRTPQAQSAVTMPAHQFQCGMLVSLGLDQHIEDLALGVDRPPEIDHTAVDFQIDLVEMPHSGTLMPSGAVHSNKSYEASGDAFVGRPRLSVRNGSPNAERFRKTPPLRVPPTNPRRRAG